MMERHTWQDGLRGMRWGMRGVIKQMMEEVRMAGRPEGYDSVLCKIINSNIRFNYSLTYAPI